MENRNYIDELVIKSLRNELSGEEETILAAWLNAGEANRKYYEDCLHAWQLTGMQETVDAIEPEVEWERFRRSTRKPLYTRLAVAATILLLIMVGWIWWSTDKPKQVIVQKAEDSKIIIRKEVNTSDTTQLYLLPDGSQVWLAANGELSWQEPFTGKRREVYMKGMAQFKAAKDSTRPFVVLASQLSVTALGTLFTINEKATTITVRLYEGKVLVQADANENFLLPGQELVFDRVSNTTKVHRFIKAKVDDKPVEDIPLPSNDRGNWYMFNNQSLGDVFENLKDIYEVEIVYNPEDVQKMYFIGKFSKSDSIETILKQIATLNHLTVVKENNAYIIRRP